MRVSPRGSRSSTISHTSNAFLIPRITNWETLSISFPSTSTPTRRTGRFRARTSTSTADQPDGFLKTVGLIEDIRKRLSPSTKTSIAELGVICVGDGGQGNFAHVITLIPNSYWNLPGALCAHLYGELTEVGIDVAGESQSGGFFSQYARIEMVDWNDGNPNATRC